MERYKLIDSILSNGEIVAFEVMLEALRTELRDDLLSDSSVRRDFRYMRNELGAPLEYEKKLMAGIIPSPSNCRQRLLVMMRFIS